MADVVSFNNTDRVVRGGRGGRTSIGQETGLLLCAPHRAGIPPRAVEYGYQSSPPSISSGETPTESRVHYNTIIIIIVLSLEIGVTIVRVMADGLHSGSRGLVAFAENSKNIATITYCGVGKRFRKPHSYPPRSTLTAVSVSGKIEKT